MKKALCFGIISLLLSLSCMRAAGDAEAEVLYHLKDGDGRDITHFIGLPDKGDEYIARDNTHYVVTDVNEHDRTALVESRGKYAMPDVDWLDDADAATPASAGASGQAVAIYCTHSDESYKPTDGASSETPRGRIYDVAASLKASLEELGVTVHYDESTHLPHDNGAYRRSRSTAAALLQEDVDAIFDVHRDGIDDPNQYKTTIDGQDASMVRLLVGKSNQNAEQNKAFAAELKAVADKLYPELIRDIYIGKGSYNQDLSANAVLLEFGTHTLDKELAEQSTAYMAQTIQKTLYGGVSGAAGATSAKQTHSNESDARERGAWSGVGWVLGAVAVAACVFAFISTGKFKPALEKLGRGAREMTGGLLGGRKDKNKK